MHSLPIIAIRPNVELKTRPKQLLGYLPSDIVLPTFREDFTLPSLISKMFDINRVIWERIGSSKMQNGQLWKSHKFQTYEILQRRVKLALKKGNKKILKVLKWWLKFSEMCPLKNLRS
jgi:hypothetical protein